jgi:hypothetical protein
MPKKTIKIQEEDAVENQDNATAGAAPAPLPFAPPQVVTAAQSVAAQNVGETSKKLGPSAVPISDVTLILGYKTKEGRNEVIHDINSDDVRIVKCEHSVEEKMRPCKEDGQLVGYEPTGEYVLTLKLKYVKE